MNSSKVAHLTAAIALSLIAVSQCRVGANPVNPVVTLTETTPAILYKTASSLPYASTRTFEVMIKSSNGAPWYTYSALILRCDGDNVAVSTVPVAKSGYADAVFSTRLLNHAGSCAIEADLASGAGASYSWNAAKSNSLNVTIDPPITGLTTQSAFANYGQSVQFRAIFKNFTSSPPEQDGTILTFFQNRADSSEICLGTAIVSNAQALLTTAALPAGAYTVGVGVPSSMAGKYVVFANVPITIKQAPTSLQVTLQCADNPVRVDSSFLFQASINAAASAATGNVSFYANNALLGKSALSGGSANCVPVPLSMLPGSYSVVAKYEGDQNYASCDSPAVNIQLSPRMKKTPVSPPVPKSGGTKTQTNE